jgi:2-oxoisovalerate dehydrogenase E1 component alpha subunit
VTTDTHHDVDKLRRFYELMYFARELDNSLIIWQRQGIVPAYPPLRGQEAAQVGSALAFDNTRDFIFPTYRDMGAAIAFGVDLPGYLRTHSGHWHGGLYDSRANRFAPIQAVVGGSVLHAVGWALGQKNDATDGVALAYFGDGASSQGDVHEAMNFAGVFEVPVVFFVQNNRWALSVPLHREVAGQTVAGRAAGYGMPGVQVDGDDVVAVYDATCVAVARARETGRPYLIEAMTYRRGPHATSDDPGRYRTLEQERSAGEDPLLRIKRDVMEADGVDDGWFEEIADRIAVEIESLREGLITAKPMAGRDMFDFVFQEATLQILDQRRLWRQESDHV